MANVGDVLPTFLRSKGHGNGNANGSANKTTVSFLSNYSLIQVNTVTTRKQIILV
jgi:hypothetical protein